MRHLECAVRVHCDFVADRLTRMNVANSLDPHDRVLVRMPVIEIRDVTQCRLNAAKSKVLIGFSIAIAGG